MIKLDLSVLNDRQKEAVESISGPVIVMAGAGSGKTRVLTYRVSYLIKEIGIDPESILAVTFTNKAAREMKERIISLTNNNVSGLWISTFHSFAARILRIEYKEAGLNKNFNIIDEEDSLKIIKDIVKENEIDEKPAKLKKLISRSKNFKYFNIKDPYLKDIFSFVSDLYEKTLNKNSLLDFDDLIIKLVKLLNENPKIRKKYQRKFNYILVDEFQDTNAMQYDLVKLLSNEENNVFVVGDDFQSIYSFRGALIENIEKFMKDYDAKLILLEENYRSTNNILNLANDAISHNENQIKKTLFSNNDSGTKPVVAELLTDKHEVYYVIDEIKKLILDKLEYKDIAILYRNNYISRIFEDAFVLSNIPYKIYGSLSFFSRMEIKDILAYLKLICNPNDDYSYLRVVNVPKRKIGTATINRLKALGKEYDISLYEAVNYFDKNDKAYNKLIVFNKLIESITANIDNHFLTDLVDIILNETHYEDYLSNEFDEEEKEDRLSNVLELKTALYEVDNSEGENIIKLEEFLSNVSLRTDADDVKNENSVTLSTYHQAKGLEYDAVFMVATEEGIFPNVSFDINIDEERRIFYVGITRAKKYLYITLAKTRIHFGARYEMGPSRFIMELDDKLYETLETVKAKKKTKKIKKNDDSLFKSGDKVIHKVFGKGVIIRERKKDIFEIAFSSPYGIKSVDVTLGVVKKIEN